MTVGLELLILGLGRGCKQDHEAQARLGDVCMMPDSVPLVTISCTHVGAAPQLWLENRSLGKDLTIVVLRVAIEFRYVDT